MAEYYTIWTETGQAKLANAQSTGTTVDITEMAFGDGDGDAYDPSRDQTSLKNEVYRRSLNDKYVHADNDNWVVFETVVPEDEGDWYIREVGLFDDDGDMVAIGKYPETYKPELDSGAGKDLYVRMIMQISNSDDVTLEIDPSVVLATRQYVDFTGDKVREIIERACQSYSETDESQLWDALELGRLMGMPGGGNVFAPNAFYCDSVSDYGDVADSAPFMAERAPDTRIDLSRGDKTIDHGGIS